LSGKSDFKNRLRGILNPVVSLVAALGVTPLGITLAGIAISIVGAVYVGMGDLFTGAILLLVSGLCDTIDGSLARRQGKESKFGAFIDSTGDRVSDLAYFAGLIFHFMRGTPVNTVLILFTFVALAGSFLTSYARARAEGLGIACSVGLLERPERIALLLAGLLFGRLALMAAIVVLAVLSVFTFLQRVRHVRKITSERSA
jgi:CDP-diacylglycerol--glycerol-3-phosphate 3-phosphatidyltransferase